MDPENKQNQYYLPAPSSWPVKASAGLLCLLVGLANMFHGNWFGFPLFLIGAVILTYVIFGWFATVIYENRHGLLQGQQVSRSFRWGMIWFIFSEVMFFGAFFASLFYIRVFVLPALGDDTSVTHIVLWPNFEITWPMLQNPNPVAFVAPQVGMEAWGVAALNTIILLTSGVTITIAHWAILKNKLGVMKIAQLITILLGITFLCMQAYEYYEAYTAKGLTLASGIYGSTFFMLTGFHGLHVTIGTIGLCAIFYRMLRGDINQHNHFAFEAVSWYWHFVDVVWLFLFVFVYWF